VRVFGELGARHKTPPDGPAVGAVPKPPDHLAVTLGEHELLGGQEQTAAVFAPLDALGEVSAADDVAREPRERLEGSAPLRSGSAARKPEKASA
jgi:hypothetical protein